MNIQPPEKSVAGDAVDLHSIFLTIQGEGPFCGTPAVFVRLAGCNLQCPGCDTEYTSGRQQLSPIEVVLMIDRLLIGSKANLIVITGGEPFRQSSTGVLIDILVAEGYCVQIETNGTLPPPPIRTPWGKSSNIHERLGAYIVVSPKAGKVHPITSMNACAWKYVMDVTSINENDGLPLLALGHPTNKMVARPSKFADLIYLQPRDYGENDLNEANLKACIASCMKHGYILQLQIHKIIGVE